MPPITVIEANRTDLRGELRDFWHYRELLGFLAWRDIRVRYRQTAVGAAWALIEPFAGMVVFTLLFHHVAGFKSGDIPYPLYCYAAMLLWNYFGRALRECTVCYVTNAALIRKVYFPRLVLPCACVLAMTVDFLCALVMYGALMLYYGLAPSLAIVTVPLWVALAAITALGVGLTLAAINVRYRDVGQALPFFIQTWMLLTPVAYPLHAVSASWRPLYQLNPMVGVIEGMRWALLPNHALEPGLIVYSLASALLLLIVGVVIFSRAYRGLADVV